VVASFPARGTKRGLRLRATKLGRATAELRCTGTGCRSKPLKLKVAKGRLDASPLKRLRFAAGQQVEVRFAADKRVGRVLRWAVTAQGATRLPDRCLTPGSHTPRGCWD
jgi:hypothetical protein